MRGRVKVGIIGTGFAASSHIDALSRVRSAEIAGIAGSSPQRGEAAASRFGITRAFPDYRALLENEDVEAVHNCTPNFLHAEITAAALRAGKHVLSEKPLGMDESETAALVGEADRARAVAGVCFNYRHYPLVRQLKEALGTGQHGPVHFIHGGYLQDWLLEQTDWNWRLDTAKGGASRAVADIGSHWLDLVQYVTGDLVEAVLADLTTLHRERLRPRGEVQTFERDSGAERERVAVATEDFGSVLLRFRSGARGAVNVSQVSAGAKNRLLLEVDTARASFSWNQEEPNVLHVGRRSEANQELARDPSLLDPQAARLAHFPGGHQEGWPDALKNLFLEFYDCVRANRRGESREASFASFSDAHRITQTVEAIVASSGLGAWVQVGARQEVVT